MNRPTWSCATILKPFTVTSCSGVCWFVSPHGCSIFPSRIWQMHFSKLSRITNLFLGVQIWTFSFLINLLVRPQGDIFELLVFYNQLDGINCAMTDLSPPVEIWQHGFQSRSCSLVLIIYFQGRAATHNCLQQ